jgi:hypothetical protein
MGTMGLGMGLGGVKALGAGITGTRGSFTGGRVLPNELAARTVNIK